MARMADGRALYAREKVTTTPERLITMLYDRLIRDMVAADQAMADGNREAANLELIHAQEIVGELLAALDQKSWSGGPQLAQLYSWLLQQLLHANIHQDRELLEHCRRLVEPLAEAWHQAAGRSTASALQQTTRTESASIGAAV